jgi:2',3'-cyclic-nucleotide 2'-phosphodiesterase (5'-nucleotidase family)
MKRSFKIFLFLCALMLVFSALAEKRKLLILQTTDIHGRFKTANGGWLRLASIIKKERKEAGADNCLLIDCGDTFQGTLEGSHFKGEAAIKILDTLNYDAWIIGNHEFDFGMNNLRKLTKELSVPSFAANLHPPDKEKSFLRSWTVINKNGIKIALIGLTLSYLENSIWNLDMQGFKMETIEKTMERIMPEVINEKPDIIILAIHQGLGGARKKANNLWMIARKYPQINLVLGGHTHQDIPGKIIGWKTWYAQAGAHGKALLKARLEFDTDTRNVSIKSELIPASANTPLDETTKKAIEKFTKETAKYSKELIGFTKTKLAPLNYNEKELQNPLSGLFCKAIAEKAGVSIAFHGTLNWKFSIEGAIREKDLFTLVPYENTIGILELTPEETRMIINEQLKNIKKMNFQPPWGIIAKIGKDATAQTPLLLQDGKAWKEGQRRKVAFASYYLAGAGGRFPLLKKIASRPEVKAKDTGILVRDAMRSYIKKNSPIKTETPECLRTKDDKQ